MDNNKQRDIRDRRFGEVELPEKLEPLTKGPIPSPKDLGPLEQLLGVWKGRGTGWNMIALPSTSAGSKFRVLMNQYDEELKFVFIDDKVPNRGLLRPDNPGSDHDQLVVTIDYQQKIAQIVAEDRPSSGGLAGGAGLPIHHEPGLWLYAKNLKPKDDKIIGNQVTEENIDVARLASVPHGNSVLALGNSNSYAGGPVIPPLSGLPSGRFEDVRTPDYDFRDAAHPDPYLEPFRHYIDHPFMENMSVGFPGFSPADMNVLLRYANRGVNIVRTTTLTVDTARKSGGITNAPFSVREAEPVSMKSTFWIQELDKKDKTGKPILRLQYSQVVMLNFFHPRQDEFPGRASWPHISIATLEKVPSGYKILPG